MRSWRPFAIGFLCAGELFAQTESRPKTWGPTRYTEATTLASEFAPQDSGVGWSFQESGTGGVWRYQTTTNSVKWWAPIRVPDGASVALDESDRLLHAHGGAENQLVYVSEKPGGGTEVLNYADFKQRVDAQ